MDGLTRTKAAIARERRSIEQARHIMRAMIVESEARIARTDAEIARRLVDATRAAGARSATQLIGVAAEVMTATARRQTRDAHATTAASVVEAERLRGDNRSLLAGVRRAEEEMARPAASVVELQHLWYHFVKQHGGHRRFIDVTGKVARRYTPGLVAIDRGRVHRVSLGHRFVLSRGKDFVAVVEVYHVNEKTCVARLSHSTKGRGWPPRQGDLARTDNPRRR